MHGIMKLKFTFCHFALGINSQNITTYRVIILSDNYMLPLTVSSLIVLK